MTEIVKVFGEFGLFFSGIMAIILAICGLYFLLKASFFNLVAGKKALEGVKVKSLRIALTAIILSAFLCVWNLYYQDELKRVNAEQVSNDVPAISESQPMENN